MEESINVATPKLQYNFLTTKQVKQILKIGDVTCLNLFHDPNFPSIKVGKAFKVREDKFWEYFSTKRVLKGNE